MNCVLKKSLMPRPSPLYIPTNSPSSIIMKNHECVILLALITLTVVISGSVWIAELRINIFAQNTTGTPSIGNNLDQNFSRNENDRPLSLTIDHAGGDFTSLQTDSDNKTWIATGDWGLGSEPSNDNQSNASVVNFNATVGMRGTDNSQGHEHKISEFRLMNSSIASDESGSVIMFNGTALVETDIGLYSDVPISIKIIDEGPIIVSIDTQTNQIKPQWIPRGGTVSVLIDERVEDHFGSTPVYGNVRRE
jgi:hypothetical protein